MAYINVNASTGIDGATANAVQIGNSTGGLNSLAPVANSMMTTDASGVPRWNTTVLNDIKSGWSNSGATVTIEANNGSNTASSDALVLATVQSGTAGDPYMRYNIAGVTQWSHGIDNSDSDKFVISKAATLGTSNALTITTGGQVDIPLGDLIVSRSSSGGTVMIEVVNLSSNPASDALVLIQTTTTGGGDAYTRFDASGAVQWSAGLDTSDADSFVISRNSTLGTNNAVRITSNGGQYKGMNIGTAPPAGFIGEVISATGISVALSTGTAANVCQIDLTAGVWNVTGMADFGGAVTGTTFRLGINSTSATMPGSAGINQTSTPTAPTAASNSGLTVCPQRVVISSTTTYYLVAFSNYTVGSLSASGVITATRVA